MMEARVETRQSADPCATLLPRAPVATAPPPGGERCEGFGEGLGEGLAEGFGGGLGGGLGEGLGEGLGDDEDPCDLVTVPTRQGLEAVDILRRGASEAVGPVLHDGSCDTLGFLVPPGTADAWDVPGSTCTQTDGRGVELVPATPVEGSGWLLSPDESDLATDPAVLRAALDEAARLIEAADNCR